MLPLKEQRRGVRGLALQVGVLTLLCVVIGGCQTLRDGYRTGGPESLEVGVTTKQQVFERLGAPREVFVGKDWQVLLYTEDVERGMGFDLKFYALPVLSMGHKHKASDTLIVMLDEKGVVESVRLTETSDSARYKLWPFGI